MRRWAARWVAATCGARVRGMLHDTMHSKHASAVAQFPQSPLPPLQHGFNFAAALNGGVPGVKKQLDCAGVVTTVYRCAGGSGACARPWCAGGSHACARPLVRRWQRCTCARASGSPLAV